MTIGRVTSRTMSNTALNGLQESLRRTQYLQNQLSTGRRVNRPSDDPAATASAMQLRTQRMANQQYQRNITDATGRLNVADSALTSISERVRKAQELVTQANNGALGTDSRLAISAELESIAQEVIELYNTKWLGRPLFGGTVPGSVAVQADGTYIGDENAVMTRINGESLLRVDVSGTAAGANSVPGAILAAASAVAAGDGSTTVSLDDLKTSLNTVLQALGDVGARAGRLESAQANLETQELDFTSRISENEDADLPETILNLESQKVAYQAALATAAQILQTSLVDYLR